MNNTVSVCIGSLLMVACLSLSVQAQSDSTYLDLGRTKLRRDLTQHITIKGKDLEKLAFTNLEEAIKVWLYGALTNRATLVYVIDGTFVQDVNAYSIHDIEEINLVQNALGQVNGAVGTQQLVLIKTRRNSENPTGITVAGQTGAIRLDRKSYENSFFVPDPTHIPLYHQYTLQARKQLNNTRVGLTTNYQRDAMPNTVLERENSILRKNTIPQHFNRLRIGSFIESALGANHNLFLGANYTYQSNKHNRVHTQPEDSWRKRNEQEVDISSKISLFNPELRLSSRFLKNFKNTLGANAQLYLYENRHATHFTVSDGSGHQTINYSNTRGNNVLIYDHLTYTKVVNGWTFEPALNISLRMYRDSTNLKSERLDNQTGYQELYNRKEPDVVGSRYITPSLQVSYRDIFYIQAGVLSYFTSKSFFDTKRNFPFVSASADILKVLKPEQNISWKIFTSVAQFSVLNDRSFTLSDYTEITQTDNLNVYQGKTLLRPVFPNVLLPGIGNSYGISPYAPNLQNSIQIGSSVELLTKRISLHYSYNRRNWTAFNELPAHSAGSGLIYPYNKYSTFHWIGLNYSLPDRSPLHWTTQVNTTFTSNKIEMSTNNGVRTMQESKNNPWTIGWVNRFMYKAFSAGADINTHFNQYVFIDRANGFKETIYHGIYLQNVYAGYTLQAKNSYPLDIFLYSQNMVYDQKLLMNLRRYYGAGFKIAL